MDIKDLTEKDKERLIIYTHPKIKKDKIEFERKEIGRLMGWNDTTLFVRFGIENLDEASLKVFFHRHGGQGNFTGCPVNPACVEFKSEGE